MVCALVAISMSFHLPADNLLSDKFPVVDQPDGCQGVDEDLGPVESPRVLRGTVVLGEGVVVVVASLSNGCDRGPDGFYRRNPGVVGLETKTETFALDKNFNNKTH